MESLRQRYLWEIWKEGGGWAVKLPNGSAIYSERHHAEKAANLMKGLEDEIQTEIENQPESRTSKITKLLEKKKQVEGIIGLPIDSLELHLDPYEQTAELIFHASQNKYQRLFSIEVTYIPTKKSWAVSRVVNLIDTKIFRPGS